MTWKVGRVVIPYGSTHSCYVQNGFVSGHHLVQTKGVGEVESFVGKAACRL